MQIAPKHIPSATYINVTQTEEIGVMLIRIALHTPQSVSEDYVQQMFHPAKRILIVPLKLISVSKENVLQKHLIKNAKPTRIVQKRKSFASRVNAYMMFMSGVSMIRSATTNHLSKPMDTALKTIGVMQPWETILL